MLHSRSFDSTVHVKNVISLCTSKAQNVTILLRNAYEGKNYKGAHVVRITGLNRVSSCRITASNNSAEGDIDVNFQADVAVVAAWDIVPGVVVARNDQVIVGATEVERGATDLSAAAVAVSITPSPDTQSLRVGQRVAVRVLKAEHSYMQRMVAVLGTMLTCVQKAPTFRLRGALTAEAAAGLLPMVEAVGRELDARRRLAEERQSDISFFEMLLYSYSSPPKVARDAMADTAVAVDGLAAWAGPPTYVPVAAPAAEVNLLDLVRKAAAGEATRVDGLWARPLGLYRSSPLAAWSRAAGAKSAAPRPDGWEAPTDEDTAVAFQTFLSEMLNFLYAIRSTVAAFSSRPMIEDHMNVWAAMRKAQKPLTPKK